MKHVTAIDNPLNGYIEGHTESKDLGIFLLSPSELSLKNHPPDNGDSHYYLIFENRFNESEEEFYDRNS